ncbi:type II toxin-antitoxin system HipA family toxin [Rubrivivax gelatinosus]|uniref:type II toxin-antitoxin system HipA family toxin n=1 Tax=Rubrivivax gelatinosus TaxID=28068 RepID=UPI0002FB42A8|nr:type II toxin-antitoxin system HipA family toxin [Rubrivivax gelatinosus]MBG6080468.1 serine/threonine-protein kinase HipA [Rubrivivax gelatinosus]
MKLTVFVQNKAVATLESPDNFEHVLTYHPGVAAEDFVSLLMPVRTKSYAYPELHPVFRMNLPEGYLLSVLQEQLGPHIGASPLSLLSVVGRNAIGRVKVAPEGADPVAPAPAFELRDILRGDNSEAAFVELVHRYAQSGVSGVVPKFLAPGTQELPEGHHKSTLATERFIIKGTTEKLPGVALNEHFCMRVAQLAFGHAARTEVSDDGQALVVHRFDYAADGATRLGMEDLCSLLALRPEQKYESTWEKVANRIKNVTPPACQAQALSHLGDLLLLTYALRNADCHTKNIALLYSGSEDVRLAPVYDMLTITVYDDYCKNPPGMSVHGRSTWSPGKALELYLQTHCGLRPQHIEQRVERLCQAVVDVSPDVVSASRTFKNFERVGPRMLHAWNEGLNSLRLRKTWSLPSLAPLLQAEGLADVARPKEPPREKLGRSPLPLMS